MTPDELKHIRLSLGLSQARLAECLGVRSNTVYRWEAGIHPIPPVVARLLDTLTRDQTRPSFQDHNT